MKSFWIIMAVGAWAGLGVGFEAGSAPAAEQVFRVTPEFPKYVTAALEFRTATDERWPSFFYGQPAAEGSIRCDPAQPQAEFTLVCAKRPQPNGDQSRRVLGELFREPEDTNAVRLRIESMAGLEKDAGGSDGGWRATLSGVLEVKGRRISVRGPARLNYHPGGRTDEKNESLFIEAQFDTTAGELGLGSMPSAEKILVRTHLTAYSPAASAGGGRRRLDLK